MDVDEQWRGDSTYDALTGLLPGKEKPMDEEMIRHRVIRKRVKSDLTKTLGREPSEEEITSQITARAEALAKEMANVLKPGRSGKPNKRAEKNAFKAHEGQ